MISSTIRKVGPFSGTGLVSTYPFSFKVFTAADLKVVQADETGAETTLVLNSTYTASLNANQDSNPGGSITLTTALPTGSSLIITTALAETQGVQLTDLGGFYPAVLNSLHDKFTVMIQQLQEQVDRCVKLPTTDTSTAAIPGRTARANTVLGFDEDGTLTELPLAQAANPVTGNLSVSGEVITKGPHADVRAYGALGDGSTNDTAAFHLAMATGRTVYVPAGTYRVNLTHSSSTTPCRIEGVPGRSILKAYTDGSAIITVNATANSVYPLQLFGLLFQGVTGHTNTKALFYKGGWTGTTLVISDFHRVENCDFDGTSNYNFTSSIEIHGRMIYSTFRDINIKFGGTTHAINIIQNGAGSGVLNEYDGAFNNNLFDKVRVGTTKARGLSIDYTRTTGGEAIATANVFINGTLEGCGVDTTVTDCAGFYAKNTRALTVRSNHFEGNAVSAADSKGAMIRLTGTYAQGFDISGNENTQGQYGYYVDATMAFGTIGGGDNFTGMSVKDLYVATSHAQSDVKVLLSPREVAANFVADVNSDTHVSFVGLTNQMDSEGLAGATTLDVTGKSLIRLTDGTDQTLSKMTGGYIGQRVIIYAAGAGIITLTNIAGTPNDFVNHGQVTQYLFNGESAEYFFNGTRWLQLSAQQLSTLYGGTPGGSFTIAAQASSNGNVRLLPQAAGNCYLDNGIVVNNGPVITKLAKYTATLSPASVAANTTAVQTFTVTGVAVGDTIASVAKPTAQAGLGIVGWYNNGANSIGIVFSNVTASPIVPTASEVYAVVVIK
jgi:hypothetical protein